MKIKDPSLREKKFAKTKVVLMNTFMERLKNNRFENIGIKEICREAEVSEATFFNYFPEKIDVVRYFLQAVTQKVVWQVQQDSPKGKFIPAVNNFFSLMAAELKEDVLYQVFSVITSQDKMPEKTPISDSEMKLAFPDSKDVTVEKIYFIDEFLEKLVKQAVLNGELPAKTKIDDLVISLMTIFAGTIVAVKFRSGMDRRAYHYERQLKTLWENFGAKQKGSR